MTQSLSQAARVVRPTRPARPPRSDWSAELRDAVRSPHELCRLLELPAEYAEKAAGAAAAFPLVAPRSFVARMKKGDPSDPLLRQVLPLEKETTPDPTATLDPVGDLPATQAPGLLHKYAGRALLIAAPSCAVHCRYCFRRHFPYDAAPRGAEAWRPALDAIRSDRSLAEVILSGGDPLTLTDPALGRLIGELQQVPHLRRLRVHTRLPIVIPSRVTHGLLDTLCDGRLKPVVVVHANHANELCDEVATSLGKLARRGALLLNQAVLLRGVNDHAHALAELSERLVDLGVTPYYLHRLDRVAGASHFATPPGLGEELIATLRKRLPGYAVPRYVAEQPGEPSKTLLA